PRARSHRETRTRGRSPLGPPRPRRPMAAEGQVAATAERLRAAFCGLGRRCAGPLPAARLAVLCAPPELKELLAAAQEFGSNTHSPALGSRSSFARWRRPLLLVVRVPPSAPPSVQGGHCGVFGLNLFCSAEGAAGAPTAPWLDKVGIIGDDEMVREWREQHASPNCAEDGWECFAACSEFDFFCVLRGGGGGARRHATHGEQLLRGRALHARSVLELRGPRCAARGGPGGGGGGWRGRLRRRAPRVSEPACERGGLVGRGG
ncbi:unnamed protein product, partial [Prorocentrum cordatum]